jgi:hypothetical protein
MKNPSATAELAIDVAEEVHSLVTHRTFGNFRAAGWQIPHFDFDDCFTAMPRISCYFPGREIG